MASTAVFNRITAHATSVAIGAGGAIVVDWAIAKLPLPAQIQGYLTGNTGNWVKFVLYSWISIATSRGKLKMVSSAFAAASFIQGYHIVSNLLGPALGGMSGLALRSTSRLGEIAARDVGSFGRQYNLPAQRVLASPGFGGFRQAPQFMT